MAPASTDPYVIGEVFGIVLVPDSGALAAFVDASRELNKVTPSLFTCGTETALPHVTLIHVETSEKDALALWGDAKRKLLSTYSVEAFKLYLRPCSGGLWVGADLRMTQNVVQSHKTTVQLANKHKHRVKNLTESDEYYWPHVTLGRWKDVPVLHPPLPSAITSTFTAHPVLARMGEHGTVVAILDE